MSARSSKAVSSFGEAAAELLVQDNREIKSFLLQNKEEHRGQLRRMNVIIPEMNELPIIKLYLNDQMKHFTLIELYPQH